MQNSPQIFLKKCSPGLFPLGKVQLPNIPWTCCVLLSARCLCSSTSVTAAQLVLFNSHFLGQGLHCPSSLPWCPAAHPALEWAVEVNPRMEQINSILDALPAPLPSIPALGCAVQVSRGVLQLVCLGLVCESISAVEISSLSSCRLLGWMLCSCLLAGLMLTHCVCVWGKISAETIINFYT